MAEDKTTAELRAISVRLEVDGALYADEIRLLKAVEAAAHLAGHWRARAFALMEQLAAEDAQGTSAALKGAGSAVHETCAKDLFAVISAALAGTDGTGA